MNAERHFEEYRQWLNNEIRRLNCYFCVYKRIHERMEDRLDEMNLAPCFFDTVIGSLFSVIVLWIEKLVSKNSERGLYNFLNFVKRRKKIEHLFAEAKEQMGLRRAQRRGHDNVAEQCLMTAMVQNIKRIVKAIDKKGVAGICAVLKSRTDRVAADLSNIIVSFMPLFPRFRKPLIC